MNYLITVDWLSPSFAHKAHRALVNDPSELSLSGVYLSDGFDWRDTYGVGTVHDVQDGRRVGQYILERV